MVFGYYAAAHRARLLSRRQRVRLADAVVRDLRRRLPHASARRDRAGRLRRPARPPRGPAPDARPDGGGHPVHRLHAGLRDASGLLAPLLVLLGRLLQGFSAGMELGGVSVYLAEIATPGHKGFYVSWQSASQQVAVMFAALARRGAATRAPARGQMQPGAGACRCCSAALIVPLVLLAARLARGDRGISGAPAASAGTGEICAPLARQLARGRASACCSVTMTTVSVLPDHRLHADLRQRRCCTLGRRQPSW